MEMAVVSTEDSKLLGKSKLLKARYNAEAVNVEYEKNIDYFESAIAANKQCEKAHLMISEYKEKECQLKNKPLTGNGLRSYEVMLNYANSMVSV